MTGDELKAARAALGLTQKALGAALDVPQATVWRWEQAKTAIQHPTILRLALESETYRRLLEQATGTLERIAQREWEDAMTPDPRVVAPKVRESGVRDLAVRLRLALERLARTGEKEAGAD